MESGEITIKKITKSTMEPAPNDYITSVTSDSLIYFFPGYCRRSTTLGKPAPE